MFVPDVPPIFHTTAGLLPFVLAGSLFSFGKGRKTPALGRRTLETVNQAVYSFLSSRGVCNFKVFTLEYGGHPVVLIKAEPQKKLRFSNILEIQIRKFLLDKLEVEISGVFWRFKMDQTDQPGPEQVDYGFDELPPYPPASGRGKTPDAERTGPPPAAAAAPQELDELYSVHHATARGMEVEEIPMGEFDEFLKGPTVPEPEKKGDGNDPAG